MRSRFRWPQTARSALVLVIALAVSGAAPEAWERWARSDPASEIVVDHTVWTSFLGRYVRPHKDGVHRVSYGEVTGPDRAALSGYLEQLSQVCVTCLRRPEQRAYWINLYNALTIDVVLAHHPVDSIRDIDISPGFFSQGPWGKKLIEVEGVAVSLDDIEHRILRPLWKDPRTHYAVNCASIGCPNLLTEAFTAENLEGMLDGAARAYVNHPRGVTIHDDDLVVSSIYSWFEVDFGGNERGVIQHLGRFAEPALAEQLRRFDSIDDDVYDWRLNDQAR
jgi:hypothetical protein